MNPNPNNEKIRKIDGYEVAQIRPPEADDPVSHPYLQLNGWPIRTGECVKAWLPEGWQTIRLELNDVYGKPNRANCWGWYICDKEFDDICPIGLFCRIDWPVNIL